MIASKTPLWRVVAAHMPLVRTAGVRRSRRDDRTAVKNSYVRKPLFTGWPGNGFDDYLDDGLVERDSGVALACDSVWEAAIFAAQANNFWPAVGNLETPIHVLATRLADSIVSRDVGRWFRRLGVLLSESTNAGHLLLLETPSTAAKFIAAAAGKVSL